MANPTNLLTQEEIDSLVNNVGQIEFADSSLIDKLGASQKVLAKYKEVLAAKKRLDWARENASFEKEKDAKRYLHHAAFSLWLANRNMTIRDFKSLIQRELKKKRTASAISQ